MKSNGLRTRTSYMAFVERQEVTDTTAEEKDPLSQEWAVTGGKCFGLKVKCSSGNKIPRYITGYASEFLCDLYDI